MSRQGVRWRFWRLFNEVYVSAYETIYLMEPVRNPTPQQALAIAKERVEMRKSISKWSISMFADNKAIRRDHIHQVHN